LLLGKQTISNQDAEKVARSIRVMARDNV